MNSFKCAMYRFLFWFMIVYTPFQIKMMGVQPMLAVAKDAGIPTGPALKMERYYKEFKAQYRANQVANAVAGM